MKLFFLAALLSALSCYNLFSQNSGSKQTAITVYNSNIAIVKDIRPLNLPKGNSIANLTDVAQLIDPTTVHIKFNGEVLEQNYQYDLVSMDKILKRYIDKDIQLINEKGELLEGTLLSVYGNQVVLKKKDAGLIMIPDIAKYRFGVGELPEGLIIKPTLKCLLNTETGGPQDVEFSYQTSGITWQAEYVAVLDAKDKMMDLNSWVSIENNCGTTFKNAELKLVAGDVHLVEKDEEEKAYSFVASGGVHKPQLDERSLFEYHLYGLERKTTLADRETKQISLFEKPGVGVTKKLLYDIGLSENNEDDNVDVAIQFENKVSNHIGVPMPKGTVRIFKTDGNSIEFIGEDKVNDIPRDDKVTLNIGSAFDVKARTVQADYKKLSEHESAVTYLVTIKNHKDETIEVEARMYIKLGETVQSTTLDYIKEDASTIVFVPQVPANTDKEFTFTIREQE